LHTNLSHYGHQVPSDCLRTTELLRNYNFEVRLSRTKNALPPMEFKRPIESTVLFGERGGAVNLIEDNKDRRHRVSIVSNQGKTSWGRVENQQLKTYGVESGIKPETL